MVIGMDPILFLYDHNIYLRTASAYEGIRAGKAILINASHVCSYKLRPSDSYYSESYAVDKIPAPLMHQCSYGGNMLCCKESGRRAKAPEPLKSMDSMHKNKIIRIQIVPNVVDWYSNVSFQCRIRQAHWRRK